jgi:DNA-binding MurR/RpiR family transcriptional regulator
MSIEPTTEERSAMASSPAEVDLVQEVREKYDALTQSQKKIAESLINDLEFAAFATVDQFAARQGVAPSTVVRFAYKLGLDGYPELQQRVRDLMLRRMKRARVPAEEAGDGPGAEDRDRVWRRSLRHDMDNIGQALGTVEEEDFDAAVEILTTADRIVAVGNLTSYCIAYYAAMTLNRLRGGTVLVTHESYAMDLVEISEGDALLAVTFAPYAKRTTELVHWARERGAQVIAITDGPLSPVAEQANVLLSCPASGLAAQNSLVAALALVNGLVNAITVGDPDRALPRYKAIASLLHDLDAYVLKPDQEDEGTGAR